MEIKNAGLVIVLAVMLLFVGCGPQATPVAPTETPVTSAASPTVPTPVVSTDTPPPVVPSPSPGVSPPPTTPPTAVPPAETPSIQPPPPPTVEPAKNPLTNAPEEMRRCLRQVWGEGPYAEIEAGQRLPTSQEEALAKDSCWGAPPPGQAVNPRVIPVAEASEAWEAIKADGGYLSAVTGSYADAEVLALPGGGFRLYVEAMETHDIVSFFSDDGLTWTREEGVRVPNAAFPDAVLLPDGRVRLYFQSGPAIGSAISDDGGLTFVQEPGLRIETGWHGDLDPDNVGASTTVLLPDGRFRMYYRAGDEDDAYFNGIKTVILSAVSDDGLNWSPEEGVRLAPEDWVDPQAPANNRYLDGPEAVLTDNGRVRLYFFGVAVCYGLCMSVSEDGLTFGPVEQVLAQGDTPAGQAPGDPSILPLADGPWLMYFGHGPGDYQGIWIARRLRPAP